MPFLAVEDIIPWMPVQRLLHPFLVQRMPDEAYAACYHKQRIQVANLHNMRSNSCNCFNGEKLAAADGELIGIGLLSDDSM
eukprot:1143307-Pelagomonas_calceolata.AAC.3